MCHALDLFFTSGKKRYAMGGMVKEERVQVVILGHSNRTPIFNQIFFGQIYFFFLFSKIPNNKINKNIEFVSKVFTGLVTLSG